MARVGIIGDTHLPFELEGYLEFCQETFDAWEVDTIVHIGDMFDNHSLSFHDSEPNLHNNIFQLNFVLNIKTIGDGFSRRRSMFIETIVRCFFTKNIIP